MRRGDIVWHARRSEWVQVRAVRTHPIRYAELLTTTGLVYTAPLSELETP